jgi:hypothetical protein
MGVSLGRLVQVINGRIELLGSGFKLCVKGAGAVLGSTTVGYGPGLSKTSCNIERSSLNYHLRYEHISHFIWLISWRANMPWLTIHALSTMHQDLLECMLLQIILEARINININKS